MDWIPDNDQLLVRPLIAADRTASGLILPDEHRERPQTGVVLAVGPGRPSEYAPIVLPCTNHVGDLVAFGKYAGVTFALDGEDVLLMRQPEVLAHKAAGTFTLVEHQIEHGVSTRTVAHEAGMRCEHCPPEPRSSVLEAERQRLLQGEP